MGGGNSAGQAAMFLSRRAAQVHLVVRGPSLGEGGKPVQPGLHRWPRVPARHPRPQATGFE